MFGHVNPLASIFADIVKKLFITLNFLDHIVSFDINRLNREQATHVQSLANLVQKNLVGARICFCELAKQIDSSTDKGTINVVEELQESFNALRDIYQNSIRNDHLTFKRLDEPEIFLLPVLNSSEISNQFSKEVLKSNLRHFVIFAIGIFADISNSRGKSISNTHDFDLYNNDKKRKNARKIFEPLLIALANQLQGNVDKIFNEFINPINPIVESKEVTEFVESVNKLLAQKYPPLNAIQVIPAMKDDSEYNTLINKLINSALESNDIKPSVLAKTILILQALRIKFLTQKSDDQGDLKMIQLTNSLEENKPDAVKSVTLSGVRHYIVLSLNPSSNSIEDPSTLLTHNAQAILDNPKLIETINSLKAEFNRQKGLKTASENRNSNFLQLFETYQGIFIRSGVELDSLIKLDKKIDNRPLLDIINMIYNSVTQYNSINMDRAAELIYILGKSFAIESTGCTYCPLLRLVRQENFE